MVPGAGDIMADLPPILETVKSKGYTVFTSGDYNLNIIGVRTMPGTPNAFDDRIYCVYKAGGEWVTESWPATCDPGTFWRDHPMNVDGCASLIAGQYRRCFRVGLHKGQYKALVQSSYLRVRRGYHEDGTPKVENGIYIGMYGINIHKAGRDSVSVDKWSAGCQVFKRNTDFDAFMRIVEKSSLLYGPVFTYTLLESKDVGTT